MEQLATPNLPFEGHSLKGNLEKTHVFSLEEVIFKEINSGKEGREIRLAKEKTNITCFFCHVKFKLVYVYFEYRHACIQYENKGTLWEEDDQLDKEQKMIRRIWKWIIVINSYWNPYYNYCMHICMYTHIYLYISGNA